MCTHCRVIINKYTRKPVYVPCGKCEACRQQRADRYARLITTSASLPGTVSYFLTLTYDNNCIPYVKTSDLARVMADGNIGDYVHIPIYRNSKLLHSGRLVSQINSRDYSFILDSKYHINYLKHYELNKQRGCIGIIQYKDCQDYLKRVRRIMARNGICGDLAYFACSEYGPTTTRPHFHLFVRVPVAVQDRVRAILADAWPFANRDRTKKYIQIARNVGAYVASYVNCSSVVPDFLRSAWPPTHSASLHFGYDDVKYTYAKIASMVDRCNLHLPINFTELGSVNNFRLLPQSVICRFYPLFKGLSRLSDIEIRSVLVCPARLTKYAEQCDLSALDVATIQRTIRRCYSRTGLSSFDDYADQWLRTWSLYKSQVLGDWYISRQCGDLMDSESYDIVTPRAFRHGDSIADPNSYSWRVAQTHYKRSRYYKKIKQKHSSNYLMASLGHNV